MSANSHSKAQADDPGFQHEYDGIVEYDNPLPGWWKNLFWITVIWSPFYAFYYHFGMGQSVEEAYESQVAEQVDAQLSQLGVLLPDNQTVLDFTQKKEWMSAMAGVFRGQCAQCHASDGGGNIGPNLTDLHWRNPKEPKDLVAVITNGAANGSMPAFGARFREPQIILLAAYVASLQGSAPANALPPDGVELPAWSTFAAQVSQGQ
ncbi:MAG: c-type cytochrome [Planctomycetaceae bacterium]|nr:c-type cytochrome [Planctomycetaceae bacterium]